MLDWLSRRSASARSCASPATTGRSTTPRWRSAAARSCSARRAATGSAKNGGGCARAGARSTCGDVDARYARGDGRRRGDPPGAGGHARTATGATTPTTPRATRPFDARSRPPRRAGDGDRARGRGRSRSSTGRRPAGTWIVVRPRMPARGGVTSPTGADLSCSPLPRACGRGGCSPTLSPAGAARSAESASGSPVRARISAEWIQKPTNASTVALGLSRRSCQKNSARLRLLVDHDLVGDAPPELQRHARRRDRAGVRDRAPRRVGAAGACPARRRSRGARACAGRSRDSCRAASGRRSCSGRDRSSGTGARGRSRTRTRPRRRAGSDVEPRAGASPGRPCCRRRRRSCFRSIRSQGSVVRRISGMRARSAIWPA